MVACLVDHCGAPELAWSSPSLVQELKVFPCQVKGNTQGFPAEGPDTVLQVRLKSAAAVVVVTVVVVVVVDVVVVVVVVAVAPGQLEEQTDSVPRIWVPFSCVLVEHQAEERRSVEAQEVQVMPRWRKGKTQEAPDSAVQEGRSGVSSGQFENWEVEQSPQLLVTTVLLGSTMVAHHGVGESA